MAHTAPADKSQKTAPNLEAFTRNMMMLGNQYQELAKTLMQHEPGDPNQQMADQLHISTAFSKFFSHYMANPNEMMHMQINWWEDVAKLMDATTRRFLGEEDVGPVIQPDSKDRRFKDPAWEEHPAFSFAKQFYLLAGKRMHDAIAQTQGLDKHTAKKVAFYTNQMLDALSPSNYLLTNPEVLRTTLETQGENLVKGMEHLIKDVTTGRISMTDVEAFKVGENIAATPGKVVYENDLMQLIQYNPTTEKVHQTPLLLMPAWINKFYIFDLRSQNSLVKWLVDQGYSVFMISWVNPDERHRDKVFDDYLAEGPLDAMEQIAKITGEKQLSIIGYCLGGTLLAITLAYLAAHGKEGRVKSATFLTTMTDFNDAGDLEVFVDDDQLEVLERRMSSSGYLDGKDMAMTFNMLRANDLIWNFVINNYLLGKDPFPFDLLYWNSDATRMPAKMHSYYLRNMYRENLLVQPKGLTIKDTPIDLTQISTPAYFLSTQEDHIAPWKATYKATRWFRGDMRFILAESGHVAGVINPPAKQKYGFYENNGKAPHNPDDWLKAAKKHEKQSWWEDWDQWQQSFGGDQVPARKPRKQDAIEDAPGRYVKVRV